MNTKTTSTTITGIDLVGATVADIKTSLAFYRDKLGLVPSMEGESGAEFELSDKVTLGIWQPGGMPPAYGVMFSVGDAREAAEECRRRGASVDEPFESPVCVMAMGRDPDGNGFVLHQRKVKNDPVPPPHARTATSINGIDIAAYIVSDPQRSIAFFRDVLGMTPTDIDEQGRGAEFTLADGSTFGVWRPDGVPESELHGGSTMFAVDDAKATVRLLRERGVAVSDILEGPICSMAFTKDPDGNGVIIHQRK